VQWGQGMDSDPVAFRPPFCPWPECPRHLGGSGFRWRPFGHYTRRC